MVSTNRREDTPLTIDMAVEVIRPMLGRPSMRLQDIAQRSFVPPNKVKICVDNLVLKNVLAIELGSMPRLFRITPTGEKMIALYDNVMQEVIDFPTNDLL